MKVIITKIVSHTHTLFWVNQAQGKKKKHLIKSHPPKVLKTKSIPVKKPQSLALTRMISDAKVTAEKESSANQHSPPRSPTIST